MELLTSSKPVTSNSPSGTQFIEANTEAMSLEEVKNKHIIPVFSRDNEPLISQTQFVETVQEALRVPFDGETIGEPDIRVSHPIKGRVPDARHKAAKDLLPSERTIYYERSIFKIDIPSITAEIEGQELCLSVGGVKAYNLDNLSKDSRSPQHFTLFIGFKNTVCSNMCLWSDGSVLRTTVTSISDLLWKIEKLFIEFQHDQAISKMKGWENLGLSEEQFCQILGRSRYYQCLPKNRKEDIFPLEITDSQMMAVARGYDNMIQPGVDGYLSLWQFYNLCTSAVKSSYVDSYVDRVVNSHALTSHLEDHLRGDNISWLLC